MASRLFRVVLLLVSVALAAFGLGQTPSPVHWTAEIQPAKAAPGQRVEVVLTAQIDAPWHLYTTKDQGGPFPTTITVTKGGQIEAVGTATEAPPTKDFDRGFKKEIESYLGAAQFRVPIRLAKSAAGKVSIPASVRFQVCNLGTCIPPKTVPLTANVTVSGKPVADKSPLDQPFPIGSWKAPAPEVPQASDVPLSDVDKAKQKGLIAYVLFAVAAGFAALLTPCVFPMIPITVSFFSKRKEGESPLKKALAYCLGIVGTFTVVGILVSATFKATGLTALANNPYLNLGLTAVFVALAFSLFGFFEVGVPATILTKLDRGGRSGLLGPLLMGLTFSLTSFTCTLPFVGAVLFSASQGDYVWPAIGMVAWSSAFCLPFFLLALFPSALSKLPRSGSWLATVKAFMGFVELAAAVKFVSSVDLGIVTGGLGLITREVFLCLWFGIALLAAAYLLGFMKLPRLDEVKIGPLRIVAGLATLVASGFVLLAINGRSLGKLEGFLPPSPYPGREAKPGDNPERLNWNMSYDQALAEAKQQGKPVFIDFTGIYCTNCRDMERNMFPRPAVEQRLEKFVRIRLFTDRGTLEDNRNQKRLQEMTNSVTLPSYVLIDPSGTTHVGEWTEDESKFVSFLDQALNVSLSARR